MRITFENATIADSINKASRVAPSKGEAFDKASGILIEVDEDGQVTIKSTNLQIFYLEVVDAVEVTGSGRWRLHASTLAQVVGKLPIGSGKMVTFEDDDNTITLKSGRIKAQFRAIDPTYYPDWEPFDPDALELVPDLGARIKQVEWAAMDDHEVVYAGIHLDGDHVMATDRIRLAIAPCEATPIYKPITIPAGILKPVLTNMRDVAVGIEDGMFLLMPDVSTQLRTRIYDREYPNVKGVLNKTWPASVKFRKQSVLEMIDRASVFAQNDRSPKLTVIIGKGEFAVMCADVEMGLLGDAITLDGQADHRRLQIAFTPKNLTQAISAAPSEEVTFLYDPENEMFPVRIDGGSGYSAVVQPRRNMEQENGG